MNPPSEEELICYHEDDAEEYIWSKYDLDTPALYDPFLPRIPVVDWYSMQAVDLRRLAANRICCQSIR